MLDRSARPMGASALAEIASLRRMAEPAVLAKLLGDAQLNPTEAPRVRAHAAQLVAMLRASPGSWMEEFLQAYGLSSAEGLALLSLAEAYLRVPDSGTSSALIRDKLVGRDWRGRLGQWERLGQRENWPVEAATLGLVLAQALSGSQHKGILQSLMQRGGEPLIRQGVAAVMQMMGGQFVLGRTIEAALKRAARHRPKPLICSFDMLGEAAITAEDAARYFEAYRQAIHNVGVAADKALPLMRRHSISVKLSALDARYSAAQAHRAIPALSERVIDLATLAAERGVGLTIDAEETDRLDMSLRIIERVASAPQLRDWDGLGMAIQAYQKAAPAVIDWADEMAAGKHRPLNVRLVKGAYWDSEIKRCQEQGLSDYPVFTRKAATDVSYLACARRMLRAPSLRPAFATHNALTVATILEWVGDRRDVEFQRLHGMGERLYAALEGETGLQCRVYAPVGGYRDLLAYLVRRLLENGANTSFIHQLADLEASEESLLADPVEVIEAARLQPHPGIPKPENLYGGSRLNSRGIDLADGETVASLAAAMARACEQMGPDPVPAMDGLSGAIIDIRNPAQRSLLVARCREAAVPDVAAAANSAATDAPAWAAASVETRAACLDRAAGLLEAERARFMALAVAEAGKTIPDALAEIREAIDFCRYYASEARRVFQPRALPGPTGEFNELTLHGRGVFGCISPWNFPLAIFMGQVTVALAAGNAVLAKPAPQTPLIAAAAVDLLHRAGIPKTILHLLPGGPEIGEAIAANARVNGVAFTGSTATARKIARSLLDDETRPIVPLIAETGGINAMIVDSTALPEQVVGDVIASAFQSAGQRCSALRLLCLQEDIAESVLHMLQGAMALLRLGDPAHLSTDIGPVIDAAAHRRLTDYLARNAARIVYQLPLDPALADGYFIPPTVLRLDDPAALTQEVFGPILHVASWKGGQLESLLDKLNAHGYGLTMGVHSRIAGVAEQVRARARVGNLYINRTMIGAVVGVQPFGGEGLSGTGPKAGGPHYLLRFATERTISIDTTSAGGNTGLLSLSE